jgi:hypothetical protein
MVSSDGEHLDLHRQDFQHLDGLDGVVSAVFASDGLVQARQQAGKRDKAIQMQVHVGQQYARLEPYSRAFPVLESVNGDAEEVVGGVARELNVVGGFGLFTDKGAHIGDGLFGVVDHGAGGDPVEKAAVVVNGLGRQSERAWVVIWVESTNLAIVSHFELELDGLFERLEVPERVRLVGWARWQGGSPVSFDGVGQKSDGEELDEGDAGVFELELLGIVVSVFDVGVADVLFLLILVFEVISGGNSKLAMGWRGGRRAKITRTLPRLPQSLAKTRCHRP